MRKNNINNHIDKQSSECKLHELLINSILAAFGIPPSGLGMMSGRFCDQNKYASKLDNTNNKSTEAELGKHNEVESSQHNEVESSQHNGLEPSQHNGLEPSQYLEILGDNLE